LAKARGVDQNPEMDSLGVGLCKYIGWPTLAQRHSLRIITFIIEE